MPAILNVKDAVTITLLAFCFMLLLNLTFKVTNLPIERKVA